MPEKKTFRKKVDEDLFKKPDISLFDKKQLSFIQRKHHLSPRELEIAQLVCMGLNDKEIAEELGIAVGTVKTHLRNVYRKIRVKNKISMLLRFVEDIRK